MPYSEKVLDHAENPRNVGTLDNTATDVGTGLVGAPACGDVMRLQIRVERKIVGVRCTTCNSEVLFEGAIPANYAPPCNHGEFVIMHSDIITDAKFKTFGCGSAIASSSLATEWLKGKTLDEAAELKNTTIVDELNLPPVKIHCSVLAEDAVKAAIADFKRKRAARQIANAVAPAEPSAPPPVKEKLVPLPPEFPAEPVAEDAPFVPAEAPQEIPRVHDPFDPPFGSEDC